MKKFTIIISAILILVLLVRYLIVFENFFFNFDSSTPVKAEYSVDSEYIYDNTGEEPNRITLRGVVLDSVLPGHYSTDYAADLEDYTEWLGLIADMGANTVTVDSILNSEFYEALEMHNQTAPEPLYLIQGVNIESYDTNNANDFYYTYNEIKEDIHRTINVIHGSDAFAIGRMESGGTYQTDVSQWTIGYILGNTWTPYTVAYTDNKTDLPTSYQGEYFSSLPQASRTEVLIADLMDSLMSYETERYKTQRLVTFNNSYNTDPLEYTHTVQLQLEKFVQMNIEHIAPSDKVQSGMFAGYMMKAGMEEFVSCLSDNDIKNYIDIVPQVNTESIYGGYVHFLNLMHDVPVVITSYGFSTSRVIDTISHGDQWDDRMTEQEQGEGLVGSYNAFMGDGSQGAMIANWQDNWSRTTWNTRFAIDDFREMYWYDPQTKDQSNGILAFDTNDGDICYVDGDISEWQGEAPVVQNEDYSLSLRYDEGYVYLMAQGEDIENTPLAIPIDITPKTGSYTMGREDLRMSHATDFMILIDGTDDSRMLVQERYDAARAGYEERITTENPFIDQPDKDTDDFVIIRAVAREGLDPSIDISSYSTDVNQARLEFFLLNVFETGKFEYGNANPNADNYNSLADYCFGEGVVEIRIPWQLLNFSDPSEMRIHDDYYPVYGVEEISIDGINIGVAPIDTLGRIQMEFVPLEGWGGSVSYTPRLKESYEIISQAWLGE